MPSGEREIASALNNIARQMHARNNIERDKVTAMQEIAKRLPMIETPAERPAAPKLEGETLGAQLGIEPGQSEEFGDAVQMFTESDEVEGMSDDD